MNQTVSRPRKTAPTWRDLLNKAANLLESEGWCQGIFKDPLRGGYCLVGSVFAVAPTGKVTSIGVSCSILHRETVTRALDAAAQYLEYGQWEALSLWNDKPGRTKQEVVEALRGAAT